VTLHGDVTGNEARHQHGMRSPAEFSRAWFASTLKVEVISRFTSARLHDIITAEDTTLGLSVGVPLLVGSLTLLPCGEQCNSFILVLFLIPSVPVALASQHPYFF
jgi:hypothetical protein